jgi:hypothetical protein
VLPHGPDTEEESRTEQSRNSQVKVAASVERAEEYGLHRCRSQIATAASPHAGATMLTTAADHAHGLTLSSPHLSHPTPLLSS